MRNDETAKFRIEEVAGRRAVAACFPVISQLRPYLTDLFAWIERAESMFIEGYRILAVWEGDDVIALAGYRVNDNMIYGKFLYVDDLVTDKDKRGAGYGALLLAELQAQGQREACQYLVLDTAATNVEARRFYKREGLMDLAVGYIKPLKETTIQDFSIDRGRRISFADQISNHIETAIRSGTLPVGARIPSWIDLAAQLGVSRGTVRAAYEKLADKNLVYSAGSAGTRVAIASSHEVPQASPDTELLLPPDAAFRAEFPILFQMGIPARDAFPGTIWGRLYKQTVQETAKRISHIDPRGAAELREAIASHVAIARGIACSPEHVIVVAGFRSALALAVEATDTRGRQAWIENPGYPVTRIALETMGTQTVAVPVDREGIDIDKAQELAPYAAMAVVTPGQQAPTGVSLSPGRRSKLIDWAHDTNGWIVEDDYLAELQLEGRSPPALAGEGHSARVIHVGTFSKTMSPSIGIGFIIAPPLLARRLVDIATWLNAPPNIAVQLALARFLKEGHYLRHLRKMRDLYIDRRRSLVDALSHVGIRPFVPVGLSVMVQLPPGYDDEYIAQAARGADLSPAPLSPWYATGSRVRSGLLLNITNVQNSKIVESCFRLKQCLGSPSGADGYTLRITDRLPTDGKSL